MFLSIKKELLKLCPDQKLILIFSFLYCLFFNFQLKAYIYRVYMIVEILMDLYQFTEIFFFDINLPSPQADEEIQILMIY